MLYRPAGYELPIRHRTQIRPQLSAASPTNRPQPKVMITIVIKFSLWLAAGCEVKVAVELSFRVLQIIHLRTGSNY